MPMLSSISGMGDLLVSDWNEIKSYYNIESTCIYLVE